MNCIEGQLSEGGSLVNTNLGAVSDGQLDSSAATA